LPSILVPPTRWPCVRPPPEYAAFGTRQASVSSVRVYVILDDRSSPEHPLGDAVEAFLRREDAERFIAEVRRDGPELARHLRIEEPELEQN